MKKPTRRLARLEYTAEMFVALGAGRFEIVDGALPADAKIVHKGSYRRRGVFGVVLESPSFAPVVDGERIPLLAPPAVRRFSDHQRGGLGRTEKVAHGR